MTDDPFARTATVPDSRPPAAQGGRVVEQLGRYRIEQQLGRGGMGVVHAAFDPDLERRVAIKLLHAAPGDVTRARLLREARAMARLSHPNVVVVHEVDTIDGRDFVAMELIDGEALADWLRTPRSLADILDVFVAAGQGLAAAHAEGIVHRDFKPHNVLRSHKGRVVVTDFGLARGTGNSDTPAGPDNLATGTAGLTMTGTIIGTPAYMAPEQWAGAEVSPATDQFAYCVALWEAIAGERPFRGATTDELRASIERGRPDPSRLPRRLRPLLVRGLSREPGARWPSMDALLAAIARARSKRAHHLLWLLAIGAGIVVAIAVARCGGDGAVAPSSAPPDAAIAPRSHAEVVASVVATGDLDFEVPRASVETMLAHRDVFAGDARVIPSISDNEPMGFKIYAIKPDSIFTAFHLQNGDTVVAIDNIGLAADRFPDIIRAVRAKSHIVVDLHRKGAALRIGVTITP